MNEFRLSTEELIQRIPARRPTWLVPALGGVVVVGAMAFTYGAAGAEPLRAWAAFLVNFLFWNSVAQAGVIFGIILVLTRCRWGTVYYRLAQAMGAYLPLSFMLYIVLILGGERLFPWVEEPVPEKAAWLNYTFMAVRNGFGLFLLITLSLLAVYFSVRPDASLLKKRGGPWSRRIYGALTTDFADLETERERCRRSVSLLAPAIAFVYCMVFSMLAGDLMMSLSPHWYSSLFGAYHFLGSLHLGLAVLAVMAGLLCRPLHLDDFILDAHRHDLGKLLFAFSMVAGDFFWSQFLVIWYGNIPEETEFIARRIHDPFWLTLSWVVLIACFIAPFVLLLARAAKRNIVTLSSVAGLIVVGYWIERMLLIVPSLSDRFHFAFGWMEVAIAAGFLALFSLSVLAFLRTFPLLPLEEVEAATAPGSAAAPSHHAL